MPKLKTKKATKLSVKNCPDPAKTIAVLKNKIQELEQLQKEERERIDFTQRVGKIGTFDWDFQHKKSTWTKQFEALYGHPNGDLDIVGIKKWMGLVHPDDRAKAEKEYFKAFKHGSELHMEFRVVWPDKSVHHLLTRARIIRDKKGQSLFVSGE
jgi:PAS domain-containing protein